MVDVGVRVSKCLESGESADLDPDEVSVYGGSSRKGNYAVEIHDQEDTRRQSQVQNGAHFNLDHPEVLLLLQTIRLTLLLASFSTLRTLPAVSCVCAQCPSRGE